MCKYCLLQMVPAELQGVISSTPKVQVVFGGEKSRGSSYPGSDDFLRWNPWSFSYTRYYGAKELPQDPEKPQGDH